MITIRSVIRFASSLPEWKEAESKRPDVTPARTVCEVIAQIREAKQKMCTQLMLINNCELWLQNTLKEYQQEVKFLQQESDHGIYKECRSFIDGLPVATDKEILDDLN